MRWIRFIVVLTGAVWLPAGPLPGLQIHDYTNIRHDRFAEGSFPAAPAANGGLWAGGPAFSGVGWSAHDNRKGFALISPRHFVGANHFRPPIGSEIRFVSRDGTVRSYTYRKFHNLVNSKGENTDIFIGELAEDIPASHGIPLYPLLDKPELELIGREIFVYGRGSDGPRIGRGEIATFNDSFGAAGFAPLNDTRNYTFEYVERKAGGDDSYGEEGDSGSPSFIPFDGWLTVSGIHSAILQSNLLLTGRTTTTYDSFLLHYRDQIDRHLSGTGHRLTLAPLQDTSLEITGFERSGDRVTLTVRNPSGLAYDVQQSTDLATWETAATGENGNSWTGTVPPESKQLFWRLVQFPLAQE